MKEKELLKIVNEILEDDGLDKLKEINDSMHLRDDIGFDSIHLATLTVKIEDKFGIDIFKNGIINTVKEIYDKLN
ncbi:MAG: acyl carrier protein [Rickettsiales bacterium TMED289]|nr:MAG: acyl carrier protein [Rickettsiales bacterium TMED289]|tara:strand:+ start:5299 stop:5523 length:225 start_codon:yes stop_codon:yes gene_type:complete